MNEHRLKLPIIFCTLLLLQGCYTLIQHPEVSTPEGRVAPGQGHNCASCHDTGQEQGNFRAPVLFDPAIESGGYAYFSDYPWWWAEPATLKYVVVDSSRTVAADSLANPSSSSGLFRTLQRTRVAPPENSAPSSASSNEGSEEKKKTEKKKESETPPVMKRKRR